VWWASRIHPTTCLSIVRMGCAMTDTRVEEIAAREKAAMVEVLATWELAEWGKRLDLLLHDASLGTLLRWRQERRALATIDELLAQLKDREEKAEQAVSHIQSARGKLAKGMVRDLLDAALDRLGVV